MFNGKENVETMKHLQNGEECIVTGFGQSMTPRLSSGQPVRCIPVDDTTELNKKDIVFCKVNGHFYLHQISAIRNKKSYQISNNHGHVNGWVSRKCIYGKVVEIL